MASRNRNVNRKKDDVKEGAVNSKVKREQPRKDNKSKRINFDNERKSRFLRDFEEAMASKRSTSNDFSWYNNNPELIQAAARIPFSAILGATDTAFNGGGAIPGIMTLTWTPRLGNQGNEIINLCAKDYYSYVVHANSRNTSYTAPDLMMITLGVGEVFSALALGVRAYGMMKRYDATNMYTPDLLLQASGFDASDLRANYSHMWFDLNNLISQVNTLWIPNDLPFIQRRVWLNTNIYMDAQSSKAQMYMFKPFHFYKYQPVLSMTGGALQIMTYDDANEYAAAFDNVKWGDYVSLVQEMIDALNNDEDRGIIMGDILKAYGPERLIRFNPIAMEYETPVVYDPSVLMQIENTASFPSITVAMGQADDVIFAKSGNYFTKSSATEVAKVETDIFKNHFNKLVLNVHQPEQPSVEQVTEMTRFTTMGSFKQNTAITFPGYMPAICGTESVVYMTIYQKNSSYDSGYGFMRFGSRMESITAGTTSLTAQSYLGYPGSITQYDQFLTWYSMFDWAPMLYDAGITTSPFMMGDLDNYTNVQTEDISRLHVACVFSEFGMGTRR